MDTPVVAGSALPTHDLRLVNGSSMIVAGPTQSGKSTFVNHLLKHVDIMFRNPISKIYWASNTIPILQNPVITYIEGLPEDFDFLQPNSILVLDDLMNEVKDNTSVTNLFTRVTHHKNVFVIFITQNFFTQCKEGIARRRNCQYIVLFKNPADSTEIRTISLKMFPNSPKFLLRAYKDATTRHPHGYVMLDLRQETHDDLRVRAQILPHELPMVVYKQK